MFQLIKFLLGATFYLILFETMKVLIGFEDVVLIALSVFLAWFTITKLEHQEKDEETILVREFKPDVMDGE